MVVLTNLLTERLHGSLAAFFTTWSTWSDARQWRCIRNAMLSLYLGLTCLLRRLESLLKVKVCHLMYAANSHCSWAVLGIGDYINWTDMRCGNGLLFACVCESAAPPMVPLAPWQLKEEYLQRLAPWGALFCIIIKDTYGVWGTVALHVCHTGSKTSPTLCAGDCNDIRFFVDVFAGFQDIL